MNILKASRQWASRPADERFSSLQELHDACTTIRNMATVVNLPFSALKADADLDEVCLALPDVEPARLSHSGFGQLASRIGAPASYLRNLPAPLAAQCLNHHLESHKATREAQVLMHDKGQLIRSVMSDFYARVWNSDITERLLNLDGNWRVPPARPAFKDQPGTRKATQFDVLEAKDFGLSVKVGDLIAPAGLYASDADIFVFMIDETKRINDGTDKGLSRGFMLWNSEVGASSFGMLCFLFRHVCGNHIVWNASQVKEIRVIHVGKAEEKSFGMLAAEVTKYAESSATDEEAMIEKSQRYILGDSRKNVIDQVLKFGIPVPKTKVEASFDLALEHEDLDGSARSVWGLAQGMTRLSQQSPYADERVTLDKVAGRILALAN